jgi:hypothetical protein
MKLRTSSQDITATLNVLVKDIKEMPYKEISKLLQKNGLPYSHVLPTCLYKNGILKKEKAGIYSYCGTHPLYYKIVDNFLSSFRDNKNKVQKTWYARKRDLNEGYCIAFLKERGYKIYKEVCSFQEV